MNTKITFSIIAFALVASTLTVVLNSDNIALAKISPKSCENAGGNQPGGQQPNCKGSGLTQNPATNPAGQAPPGQQ